MSLDFMTLNQLRELALTLTNIEQAGAVLAVSGLDPIFDLSPGFMVTITLPYMVPHANNTQGAELAKIWEKIEADSMRPTDTPIPSPEPAGQAASEGAAIGADVAEPLGGDAPVAVPDPAAGAYPDFPDPEPVPDPETLQPETAVEQTPSPPVVDDSGTSAGGQGSGSIPTPPGALLAPPAKPSAWTEDEDSFVIKSFEGMRARYNKPEIINYCADYLDRPREGTKFRCYNKLRARIDAVYADAAEDLTKRAPDPVPTATVATAPVRDVQGSQSYTDYYAHIRADGWDLGLDQTLMQMACDGWAMADIGLDLGFDGKKVQARFDALTGLTKIAGKEGTTQLRLHNRREVLDWLIKQIPAATTSAA